MRGHCVSVTGLMSGLLIGADYRYPDTSMQQANAILLVTVEHSGTNRALSFLARAARHISTQWRETRNCVVWAHLDEETMPAILALARELPTITTQRPVEDIRASWARRGRLPAEQTRLDAQLANHRRLLELKPYVLTLGV
jgi:hypothetical protein